MSFTNIPNDLWEWQIDNKSLPNSTRIMALIIRYTICFHREYHEISLSFIAERTGILRNNVSRELKALIKSGLIREKNHQNKRVIGLAYSIKSDNSGVIESDNRSVIKCDNRNVIKSDNQEINNINKKHKDDHFEAFWIEYPRKVSKQQSIKAFNAAIKKATVEQIIEGVKGYKQSIHDNQTDERFIKHPTTFLNNCCWEDYKPRLPEKSTQLKLLELHGHKPTQEELDHLERRYAALDARRNCH